MRIAAVTITLTMALEPPQGAQRFLIARHGETNFNAEGRIQGTLDTSVLTARGVRQAEELGCYIADEELARIAKVWVSPMTRARQTLDIVLKITGQEDVPVNSNWRLNERMYGGLTGLNKKETVAKYGEAQVKQWRRSYSTPPPPIDKSSEYWPGNDNKYAHIPDDEIPLSECLKDTVDRCLPYWKSDIMPALQRGKTVLVAAHGNSIRGMLK